MTKPTVPTAHTTTPTQPRLKLAVPKNHQYRSQRLSGIAEHLEPLLSQAEAKESSYLHFAQS